MSPRPAVEITTHRARLLLRTLAASFGLAIVAVAAGGVAAAASPPVTAAAAPSPWPVNYLVLETEPRVLQFPLLSPGDVVYGQVRMKLENAPSGALSVTMRTSGPLASHPDGLLFEARLCDAEFTGIPIDPSSDDVPVCALHERSVIVTTPGQMYGEDAPVWDLAELTSSADRFLLITLRMPPATTPPDASIQGLAADFAFQVRVEGENTQPAGGPDLLATTGIHARIALALAVTALVIGAAFRTVRRRQGSAGRPNG
jgi:hypothetical protein